MARLLLYSEQLDGGEALDKILVRWLSGTSHRIGYLPSAPDPERCWFEGQRQHYERLGLDLRYFGLEEEYDPAERCDLLACDAIHLTGGNTFQFLYWLRARGLVEDLGRYVAEGGVLVGVSAGAIVITPDIGTSLVCGDVPYLGLRDHAGLGLVEFAMLPHFDGSAEMEAAARAFSLAFGGTVYGVPDGGGIVVEGRGVQLMGEIRLWQSGVG